MELTKRNVVSVAGRFYNPLGFLTPVMLRFKLAVPETVYEQDGLVSTIDGFFTG